MSDELGHRFGDAHDEREWPAGRLSADRCEEISTEGEDLVSVTESHLAGSGALERAAGSGEELLAKRALKGGDRRADRGLREPQRRARAMLPSRATVQK